MVAYHAQVKTHSAPIQCHRGIDRELVVLYMNATKFLTLLEGMKSSFT